MPFSFAPPFIINLKGPDIMTKSQLKKNLDKALYDFSNEINLNYKECGKTPVTDSNIYELSRQTFYVLSEFEKAILEYLD